MDKDTFNLLQKMLDERFDNIREEIVHIKDILEGDDGIVKRVGKLETDREVQNRTMAIVVAVIGPASGFVGSMLIPMIINFIKNHWA